MENNLFKWKHFEAHIILLCVRWYLNRIIRKHLNNIVEQDHRFIKRKVKPMIGFKSFKSACSTISGIEIMHMLHKNQAGKITPFEEKEFINLLMNVG